MKINDLFENMQVVEVTIQSVQGKLSKKGNKYYFGEFTSPRFGIFKSFLSVDCINYLRSTALKAGDVAYLILDIERNNDYQLQLNVLGLVDDVEKWKDYKIRVHEKANSRSNLTSDDIEDIKQDELYLVEGSENEIDL